MCKLKVNKILRRVNDLMSSLHNRPEILIPPKGVCMNFPRLEKLNCKDCIYFEGCTNKKKGNYKKDK